MNEPDKEKVQELIEYIRPQIEEDELYEVFLLENDNCDEFERISEEEFDDFEEFLDEDTDGQISPGIRFSNQNSSKEMNFGIMPIFQPKTTNFMNKEFLPEFRVRLSPFSNDNMKKNSEDKEIVHSLSFNTLKTSQSVGVENFNYSPNKTDKFKIEEEIKKNESNSSEEEDEIEDDNECIMFKVKDEVEFSKANKAEILKIVSNFNYFPRNDEKRIENSHKKGGKVCNDRTIVKNIRSVGSEILKDCGKKIFNGSFNLTTISFPIKAMIPKSSLEASLSGSLFVIKLNIYFLMRKN